MADIKDCCSCIYETRSAFTEPCVSCGVDFRNYVEKPKPKRKRKTNADLIRDMTDEELAEFLEEQTSLAHNYGYECADGEPDFPDGIPANYDYLTWLQEEVKDD